MKHVSSFFVATVLVLGLGNVAYAIDFLAPTGNERAFLQMDVAVATGMPVADVTCADFSGAINLMLLKKGSQPINVTIIGVSDVDAGDRFRDGFLEAESVCTGSDGVTYDLYSATLVD